MPQQRSILGHTVVQRMSTTRDQQTLSCSSPVQSAENYILATTYFTALELPEIMQTQVTDAAWLTIRTNRILS